MFIVAGDTVVGYPGRFSTPVLRFPEPIALEQTLTNFPAKFLKSLATGFHTEDYS